MTIISSKSLFLEGKIWQKFVDVYVIVMSRDLVKGNNPKGQGIEVYTEVI